jgi:hypothetical protein
VRAKFQMLRQIILSVTRTTQITFNFEYRLEKFNYWTEAFFKLSKMFYADEWDTRILTNGGRNIYQCEI